MPFKDVFIIGAKRSAVGNYGGTLKGHTATDLAEFVSQAVLRSSSIKPENIDHIIFGNVIPSSKDSIYLARTVGLRVNIPIESPAITTNRLCGSGFESIIEGARQILIGDSTVVLAGGTECMSNSPFIVRDIRFGAALGSKHEFEDMLWEGLTDQHIKTPMAITAENLGEKYGITRKECDEYTFNSHKRWKIAYDAGYFKNEIEPISLKSHKGEILFDRDERAREIPLEKLNRISPTFRKNGLITVASASGVSDGAAVVILAGEESVQKLNLNPLARLIGWKIVGCDPHLMGIGPVEAIRYLLKTHKLTLDDIDLFEINEAFAPQILAVKKELNLDHEKLNINGGAIAIGHPIAASGSRIITHLAHELRRRKAKYGIGAACVGGGQGVAILLERV